MKECPHCSRKFLNTTADRHIPLCAKMKHKAKPIITKDQLAKKEIQRRKTHLNPVKEAATGSSIHVNEIEQSPLVEL